MRGHIVVGVDTSEPAQHALAWAMNEGELRGEGVVAVLQYHYPWAPAPVGYVPRPLSEEELQAEAERDLEHVIDKVVRSGGWSREPQPVVRFGPSAVRILCEEADEATMLVVGQRGGGGFLGLRLGSVSEGCLHRSPNTVAIVPSTAKDLEPVRRVTVGVDGSPDSVEAVRWAVDEAARLGVPVRALMAWSWVGPPLPSEELTDVWDSAHAVAVLDRALDRGGTNGVERELVEGRPAPALIEASAEGDLVVVGAHGHSRLGGALVGSVSRQLAHHAAAPVVIVRGAAEARDDG